MEEIKHKSKWLSLDSDIICELYRYSHFTINDIIRKIHSEYNEVINDEYGTISIYSIMLIEEDEYRIYNMAGTKEVVLSMEDFYTQGFTVVADKDNSEDLAYIWRELDEYGKL